MYINVVNNQNRYKLILIFTYVQMTRNVIKLSNERQITITNKIQKMLT